MGTLIALPIPIAGGVSPWVTVAFSLVALAGVAVLVWRVVRYFRSGGDDHDQFGPRDR
jgi:threonine/homoserine/homoserine lactone efflux protein